MAGVESPCVRECVIDAGTGYCRGCCRTLDEISFWVSYTDEERQRVMESLPARQLVQDAR
jgi:predicted Fe-S protein YdhL (DUF1289 family)